MVDLTEKTKLRFQDGSSVDGRPNRRNKAEFSGKFLQRVVDDAETITIVTSIHS